MSESSFERHLRTLARLRGTLRLLVEQEQTAQRVLAGAPVSDIARFQRYVREAGWPLQVIALNQRVARSTIEGLAAMEPWEVATPDVPLTAAQRAWHDEASRWLVDFVAAVVELRPG